MSKRTDVHKILVIGAGPIIIGQACEFDYSGTQACKALKEEGYEIVLVNSNPATIMTDPQTADRTYIEPLTPEVLEKIIAEERPDALLPTVGGQTALNLAMALHHRDILSRYNVELIGAKPETIEKAEARDAFKKAMASIGLATPHSTTAYTLDEAIRSARDIGYPCVVRPAFTLGGTGGGHANDEDELRTIVEQGLRNSIISEVLIEESIIGWKEYELEVMRDKKDNVVVVCSIENIDPMGVHTGDSITVAPAQTLTDLEYQSLRDAAIAIMREIGVDTGGSNVQFAINPQDGRMVVIEMNPRVSRSSALASKATGFPIAKLAAKLAVGYTLDELKNDITKKTPACFEPALDYCVVKFPRFDTRKFTNGRLRLGTAMKSVGEAMAIGRTFKEAFQKGVRSLELGRFGFGFDGKAAPALDDEALVNELTSSTPERILYVGQALERGYSVHELHEYTRIDPWFLHQFRDIVTMSREVSIDNRFQLRRAKRAGFSDTQIAYLTGQTEQTVRTTRHSMGITPTYALVDTCAGEFEAYTPYYYSSYETRDERLISQAPSVMIIGGGPNRIGQGIEFDYCCVHASFAIREAGLESIMVNSNPETVSTDFDTSDKLFFEPLTVEDVLNIHEAEKPTGVIVQFGGQTPLNLAHALEQAGVKILGTCVDSIDRAEDRERSKQLLEKLRLRQPPNGTAVSLDQAIAIADRIGYPVVVRPSYVIGGTSMRIVHDDATLRAYMQSTPDISEDKPVLIDRFLENAIEVDVDCLADGENSIIIGVLEHIEPAGVHSGDSACVLPPHSLSKLMVLSIKDAAQRLAKELKVVGLLNVQFAVKDDQLYVIEVNPRASRTVPFISKACGVPWVKIATKVILGQTIAELGLTEIVPKYYAVKESIFPFDRFDDCDTLLGPEMKSTGEAMGIDASFAKAFIKSQLAVGQQLSKDRTRILVSLHDRDKPRALDALKSITGMGYTLFATDGTYRYLREHGVAATGIEEAGAALEGSALSLILQDKVDLVLNTADPADVQTVANRQLRRAVLMRKVPFFSTVEAFSVFARSVREGGLEPLTVRAVQDYYSSSDDLIQLHPIDKRDKPAINLFIRQSFTESSPEQSRIILKVLKLLQGFNAATGTELASKVNLLTGMKAYHKDNFKQEFEKATNKPFTPKNFRSHRLDLLNQADGFVIIRTALSESSVFEITYNIYKGNKAPIFFAIHESAPIKTTLLRDLQDLIPVTYHTFRRPEELAAPFHEYLMQIQQKKRRQQIAQAYSTAGMIAS